MNDSTQTSPTPHQTLCAEHVVIKRVLWVLRQLVDKSIAENRLDVENLDQCLTFFRLFADACHHAKEEDVLFPVLQERGIACEGGPIGVMLDEHREGRRLVGQMRVLLADYQQGNIAAMIPFRDTACQYINLLTMHIHKEDNVLFVMGDRVMTDRDQKAMCRRFTEVGCRHFEGKAQEDLAAIADDLEHRLSQEHTP